MSRFRTLRGRPRRAPMPEKDLGTPELIYKRAHGLTTEPLDACLQQGFITEAQHWCGMHLRWLHTLRYGAPDPISLRWAEEECAGSVDRNDPLWAQAREEEYLRAIQLLKLDHCLNPIMRLCIYHHPPVFLQSNKAKEAYSYSDIALAERLNHALAEVQTGLEALVKLWRKSPSRR